MNIIPGVSVNYNKKIYMIPRSDFLGSVWFRGFNLITAILSILGTLYIICFCRRLPSLSVSMKMIKGIAFADLVFAITNIMSHFQDPEELKTRNMPMLCFFEAHLRNIAFFFSLIFIVGVAIVSSPYEYNKTWLSKDRIIKTMTRIGIVVCIVSFFG